MKTNSNDPINVMYDETFSGLTKREYFAAMAMQGILSSDMNICYEAVCEQSVKCADLLIIELNKDK